MIIIKDTHTGLWWLLFQAGYGIRFLHRDTARRTASNVLIGRDIGGIQHLMQEPPKRLQEFMS